MRKIFAVVFSLLFLQNVVRAQQIEVLGVDENLSDLSARVHERKDGNGDPCALVKVMFPVEGAKFDGDIVGDVKYDTGVYWVYMIAGSKKITISHPQYIAATLDFSKYSINGLQAQKTYIVKVKAGESKKLQSLTISFSPSSAIVLIDGKKYPSNNGKVIGKLPVGKHDFIVAADGYDSYEGAIVLREFSPGNVEAHLIKSAGIENTFISQKDNINTMNNVSSQIFKPVNNTYTANSQYILDKVAEGKRLYYNKDYTTAYKCFLTAAEAGNAEAQYGIGVCYYYGYGVEQNYAETVKWCSKAAEQGLASAQNDLGRCFENGEGVEQNYAEAVRWYRKAAEQENDDAQYNLGRCYYFSRGVANDYTEAVKWYRRAANQGYADAQNNLGVCYKYGQGVEQNYTEAVKWYLKAAEQGLALAQKNLGRCYEYGQGVARDNTEAMKWYKKAAEQGDEEAKKIVDGSMKTLRLKVICEEENLIGASIHHKRNGKEVNGTISDLDGCAILYKFQVGDVLTVSYIGYRTQEIQFNQLPAFGEYTVVMKEGNGTDKIKY